MIELKPGYTFSFENELWKVAEAYTINWRDNTSSFEYKVKSGTGAIRYLEIAANTDNTVSYSFWTKAVFKDFANACQESTAEHTQMGKFSFPKLLNLYGIEYNFIEIAEGVYQDNYETAKLFSWDYANTAADNFFSIEIWEDETEVSTGRVINEADITGIEVGKAITDFPLMQKIGKYIIYIVIFIFVGFGLLISQCSRTNTTQNGYGENAAKENDSTRVNRSNNYYRRRNSTGFGK